MAYRVNKVLSCVADAESITSATCVLDNGYVFVFTNNSDEGVLKVFEGSADDSSLIGNVSAVSPSTFETIDDTVKKVIFLYEAHQITSECSYSDFKHNFYLLA